ncbi:MAG: arylsulfatase [Bryobacterales bacterium]|nr:arylsulfatase [Bryobacterales bacterium]
MSPFAKIALVAALATGATAAGGRPNVVLIITDDQGYGDLSCHGNPVLQTPNLDRLHGESVRLIDYHVAPTCSPTRAALLTGHWTNRTGAWHTSGGRSLLLESEVTMGQVFLDAGYATGMFGKWHLGDNYPFRAEDRGFSEVMRHGGGGVGQTPDFWDNSYFDGTYFHNLEPEAVQGYCTDVWFDYAQRFITAQEKAGKPFFAYISTNAPHWPMHAPQEFAAPYEEQFGTHVGHFLGMIANIDHNVGRLRTFLEREGLAENTIFIFTTDNGTGQGHQVFNAGMRGRKQSEFDGGHRVPLFIHWPAGGLVGGRDVEPITAHVDILPTLIDLAGIAQPDGVKFDGRSIRPLLEGKASLADGSWPDRILVTDSQRVLEPIKWRKSAVMTARWRLVNGTELYDIKRDPKQENDVAGDQPGVVARLKAFYEAWWAELEPTFRQVPAIYLGHAAANPVLLTSHDWITTEGREPWNQSLVRKALDNSSSTGYWNVQVVTAGDYEVRLRRWPEESDTAIDAPLPPGANVPGDSPFRASPGKAVPAVKASVRIGEARAETPVEAGPKEVTLRMTLPAGTARMTAVFTTRDGGAVGAFYAYVRKVP